MTMNAAAGTQTGGGVGLGSGDNGAGAPLVLNAVSRSFGTVRALDQLSLDIAPGELVALLGPSGCGKTTALRIVAGFEFADSGSVSVDGKDIAAVPAAKRDMGMVFQSYSLFPNMTALDNVGFGLRMRKMSGADRARRAGALLEMVDLATQARQYPASAVRRPATARRARPRTRCRATCPAARRAAVGAGRQGQAPAAGADQDAAAAPRHDYAVRHTRSGRSAVDG